MAMLQDAEKALKRHQNLTHEEEMNLNDSNEDEEEEDEEDDFPEIYFEPQK